MAKLIPCAACGGFLRPADAVCPHCDRSTTPARKTNPALLGLLGVCGGSIVAVTLMACYGLPPCDGKPGCYPDPPDQGQTTDGGTDAGAADGMPRG